MYYCPFPHTHQNIHLIIPQSRVFHLCLKEFFNGICTLVILRVWFIVSSTICEDVRHVGNEQSFVAVVAILQSFGHRLQIWKTWKYSSGNINLKRNNYLLSHFLLKNTVFLHSPLFGPRNLLCHEPVFIFFILRPHVYLHLTNETLNINIHNINSCYTQYLPYFPPKYWLNFAISIRLGTVF